MIPVNHFTVAKISQLTLAAEIPSIIVQGTPETPPLSSRDIASAGLGSPSSPTPIDYNRFSENDYSLTADVSGGSRLQRSSNRRNSDIHSIYGDIGRPECVFLDFSHLYSKAFSRISWAEEEPHDVVNALQSSVWGGQ